MARGGELSPEAAYMYAYGLYLGNGGRPDDFMDLDDSDIAALIAVHEATEARKRKELFEGLAKMIAALFKG